jgi:hypothetical protein
MMNLKTALIAALMALGMNTAEAKFARSYNHPDLEWYSIETEHFVVHYSISKESQAEGNEHYLTGEWSARKMAQVGEDMWPKMCAEFNYYLKERVHIVLMNHGDNLEGFTIPTWDWIEISANPGGTFYRSRGRMEWVSDVLVHEFAHVVSLKANSTLSEGTQGVLFGGLYQDGIHNTSTGIEFFIMDGDSVFWTEGGAEYWSDNTGYNWWTASRDQNIRMTVLEDRLLEYKEWHTRAGKRGPGAWNDHERYYQQGYSFGQYLRLRFGNKTYAKFALEYGKAWRPNWETIIVDVLGIDAETLYWDWREYVMERYTAQYDAVKARGEVMGKEILGGPADWDFTDPGARDEFYNQKRWQYEYAKEKTGLYQWEPRISDDGRHMGVLNRAVIQIAHIPEGDEKTVYEWSGHGINDAGFGEEAMLGSTFFHADFEHGWDFVPGQDSIVLTGREDEAPAGFAQAFTGVRLELDGYNWKELYVYDMPYRDDEKGNRTLQTRNREPYIKGVVGTERYAAGSWRKIPNTLRAVDPAVSPDGKTVAFFQYTDGVLNLGTIGIDGTNRTMLTTFDDGTWMQKVDWSPDGEKLVLALFRNHRQNLYTVNKDGSDLTPIMWDQWEELDAHWAKDGKIYFGADADGIFNIYSYDPEDGSFLQITNVIGGAHTPQISPEGNLLYTYYTAHGWKLYGLAKEEFFNAPADHLFRTDINMDVVASDLAFREDLSHFEAVTTKYQPAKSFNPPTVVPMFRLENDSVTNWGLQSGAQIFVQDFNEEFGAFVMGMLGEDSLFLGQAFYQGWHPTLMLTGYRYDVKYDGGYLLDRDDDTTTTDDQSILEIKNQQFANIVMGSAYYPWNSRLTTGAFAKVLEYGFKGASDVEYNPYLHEIESGMFFSWANNGYFGRSPNPYFGRTIELNYSHGWTDVVYAPYGGVATDDGQELDNYEYNKVEVRWVEQIPVSKLGFIPILRKAGERKHTIQFDARLGATDRNVDVNDEFRAGGQHPYQWGYGSLRPNTLFAGYPGSALAGETMAIFNLAYRFPVDEFGRHKIGPLYTHGIYGQFSATAGNLWSFRAPEDESQYYNNRFGERVAHNPEDIRREIPFVDKAYKNGNHMLYDVAAELRVQSVLFHGASWDSFLRLAYGFNEVRGYGDVNGDDIYDTSESALGDELSNETEAAGFRLYVGLGTGW